MMFWAYSWHWGAEECIQNLGGISLPLKRLRRRWENYIQLDFGKVRCEDGRQIKIAELEAFAFLF